MPEALNSEAEDGSRMERLFASRVAFSALRMSDAELPPLKRCSWVEEREEARQAGGWKGRRGGGVRREGSLQPRPAAMELRSLGAFGGGWGKEGDAFVEVEGESVGVGGGGAEDVVGRGLIAGLWEVVDRERID